MAAQEERARFRCVGHCAPAEESKGLAPLAPCKLVRRRVPRPKQPKRRRRNANGKRRTGTIAWSYSIKMREERQRAAFPALSARRSLTHFRAGFLRVGAAQRAGNRHTGFGETAPLCYNFAVRGRRETNQALFCLRIRSGSRLSLLRATNGGKAGDRRLREKSSRWASGSAGSRNGEATRTAEERAGTRAAFGQRFWSGRAGRATRPTLRKYV